VEKITLKDLPPINPLKLPAMIDQLLEAANSVPEIKEGEVIY